MQTTQSASSLSSKQREALLALVSGATVKHAAEKAGVHRATVHSWCHSDPDFSSALETANRLQVEMIHDELRTVAQHAVQAIENILTDPATPASVRLRAALAVIEKVSDPPEPGQGPKSENEPGPEAEAEQTAAGGQPPIPRGAPCPCGSGRKFKRCCGQNAPAVLGPREAARAA